MEARNTYTSRNSKNSNAEKSNKFVIRKKVCRFCKDSKLKIDYKDPKGMRYFVSERGRIIPRRITGNCARHQREVTVAVKRARNIALLPFTTIGIG